MMNVDAIQGSPWDLLDIRVRWANHPTQEQARDELLNDVYRATEVAVKGDKVIAKTPLGACVMMVKDVDGSPIVVFDHIERDGWKRTSFWFNKSSVRDVGNILRKLPRRAWVDMLTEVML